MYVDYEFYKTEYIGKISEDDFPRLRVQAKGIIDYYTFNRIIETNDSIKMAMCELIDYASKLENTEGKEIASEKVGNYSIAYATNKTANNPVQLKQREIVYKHLAHTGILYRGL